MLTTFVSRNVRRWVFSIAFVRGSTLSGRWLPARWLRCLILNQNRLAQLNYLLWFIAFVWAGSSGSREAKITIDGVEAVFLPAGGLLEGLVLATAVIGFWLGFGRNLQSPLIRAALYTSESDRDRRLNEQTLTNQMCAQGERQVVNIAVVNLSTQHYIAPTCEVTLLGSATFVEPQHASDRPAAYKVLNGGKSALWVGGSWASQLLAGRSLMLKAEVSIDRSEPRNDIGLDVWFGAENAWGHVNSRVSPGIRVCTGDSG